MKINLFKIKEGKLGTWKSWCNMLATTRKNEALETLKEESLAYEGFFIFSINQEFYTLGITEGEGLPANMDKEINQKHKAIKKECLERMGSIENGYELTTK